MKLGILTYDFLETCHSTPFHYVVRWHVGENNIFRSESSALWPQTNSVKRKI